jgi:hypothetical protein
MNRAELLDSGFRRNDGKNLWEQWQAGTLG